MNESKGALRSKTMWTNTVLGLVGLLSAIFPAVGEALGGVNKVTSTLSILFPVVNMVLRLVSKDKVYLVE